MNRLALSAILLGAPAHAWVAMACMLAAAILSVAIQATVVIARMARTLPKGPRRYRWRHWLGASLPIALIDLANAGFTFVDVVVLGFLMPPSAVGLYFAATRIQQFVVFVHFAAVAATDRLPWMVLLLDRWEGFLGAFEHYDYGRLVDQVVRLLREGAAAGLRAVFTGDRSGLGGQVSTGPYTPAPASR